MNVSNFFITGGKGVGKSTLLKALTEELELTKDLTGFVTLPYFEKEARKGFYLHSMIEVEGMTSLFLFSLMKCLVKVLGKLLKPLVWMSSLKAWNIQKNM